MSPKLSIVWPLLLLFHCLACAGEVLQVSATAKAGLPWPNGPGDNIDQYRTTEKVQWYYSWGISSFDTDLEFVPMLWGNKSLDVWDNTIHDTISNRHVNSILGFNEPQQPGQSNLTVDEGVTLWQNHIQPLRDQFPGLRFGSPAPSSAPSGKTWLQGFLGACQGCNVDFIALHWYDINSTNFINYLEDFHTTFSLPLWVTEWACQNFNDPNKQCSQQDVVDFMNATQAFMDNTSWVERYAWFGAMTDLSGVNQFDALMDSQGRINSLGEQYIGAITPNVSANYTPGDVHGGSGSSGPGVSVSRAVERINSTWATVLGTLVLVTVLAAI